MRDTYSDMKKDLITKTLNRHAVFFLFCLLSVAGFCQTGENAVDTLVKMGFENVGCTDNEKERVYVVQNSAYRLQGVGIGEAVDVIQRIGLPEAKPCRIIVLDNNVPQISLFYTPLRNDSLSVKPNRGDWNVSYDLGDSWKQVKKIKKENRSLFKVDVVVYPELKLKNLLITEIYQVLFNLNPAIEVSLWNGMKFIGQVIVPVYNEYGKRYGQVRQGYITLSQSFRLPYNVFVTATVGTFNNNRWGGELYTKHVFKDERFMVDAKIGYSGKSWFDDWRWKVSPLKRITWSLGGGFYWSRYNTQFTLRMEKYLLGEKGAQVQMTRHFRYASIGFYGMKVQYAGNNGFNGGFRFQIALPPYKYKRRGYVPRILPSEYFGMSYNAGNEQYYGKSFNSRVDDNIASDNAFNPYFIKSELLNY